MDLETPSEGVCLLCNDEQVEYDENKNGKPYFQCSTFNAIVNLRPSGDRAETILSEAVEDDGGDRDLEEPPTEDEDGEDGETSLGDLLGGDDE